MMFQMSRNIFTAMIATTLIILHSKNKKLIKKLVILKWTKFNVKIRNFSSYGPIQVSYIKNVYCDSPPVPCNFCGDPSDDCCHFVQSNLARGPRDRQCLFALEHVPAKFLKVAMHHIMSKYIIPCRNASYHAAMHHTIRNDKDHMKFETPYEMIMTI